MLAQVPLATIRQLFVNYTWEMGRCIRVSQTGNQYALVFEHGVFIATGLSLDSEERIANFTGQFGAIFSSLDEATQSFPALPGQVSLLVVEDGRTRVALNTDTPRAYGSTFKLSVLTALRQQVEAGRHARSETISLRPLWKSLPSASCKRFSTTRPSR